MSTKRIFCLLSLCAVNLSTANLAFAANTSEVVLQERTALRVTPSLSLDTPVRSWKSLRDARVVKQDLDFSCGAASLATLLNEFYGQNFSEQDLLKAMDNEQGRASFAQMQKSLPSLGFVAQGYAANFEQLMQLKIPVIVYLKHRKDDHFSVLRGISADAVWLSDPSLGNRTFSRAQFLEMWETRDESQEHGELKGKFLAVLPADDAPSSIQARTDFFTKQPTRQSAGAVHWVSERAWGR